MIPLSFGWPLSKPRQQQLRRSQSTVCSTGAKHAACYCCSVSSNHPCCFGWRETSTCAVVKCVCWPRHAKPCQDFQAGKTVCCGDKVERTPKDCPSSRDYIRTVCGVAWPACCLTVLPWHSGPAQQRCAACSSARCRCLQTISTGYSLLAAAGRQQGVGIAGRLGVCQFGLCMLGHSWTEGPGVAGLLVSAWVCPGV